MENNVHPCKPHFSLYKVGFSRLLTRLVNVMHYKESVAHSVDLQNKSYSLRITKSPFTEIGIVDG